MEKSIRRILVLCLFLILLFSFTTYGQSNIAASANNTGTIYNWKQMDSRWNKIYPAKWSSGCALTSIAVQIARTGLVTVDESAKTFNKNNGCGFNPGSFAKAWKRSTSSLAVSWTSQTNLVPGFITVTKNVVKGIDSKAPNPSSAHFHYYNATSKQQICKAMKYLLDKGYYPIIEGPGSKWNTNKSSVHYVAVVKATANGVRVIDPSDGKDKSLFSVNVGGGAWSASNIEKCGKPKGYGCCILYKADLSKKPASFTHSFSINLNGGTGAISNFKVTDGATFRIPSTKPVKSGYEFTGWIVKRLNDSTFFSTANQWEDSSSTAKLYLSGQQYTMNNSWRKDALNTIKKGLGAESNYRLIAQWQKIDEDNPIEPVPVTHYFSFGLNEGSGTFSKMKVADGESFTIPTAIPVKNGYTFRGWYLKRVKDNTWYYKGIGWMNWDEAKAAGYTPAIYSAGRVCNFNSSFTKGCTDSDYRFYAQWKKN